MTASWHAQARSQPAHARRRWRERVEGDRGPALRLDESADAGSEDPGTQGSVCDGFAATARVVVVVLAGHRVDVQGEAESHAQRQTSDETEQRVPLASRVQLEAPDGRARDAELVGSERRGGG